jgi:signal transduction histidine kinase
VSSASRQRNPVESVVHGLDLVAGVWQGLWLLSVVLASVGKPITVSTGLLLLAGAGWAFFFATRWMAVERLSIQRAARDVNLLTMGITVAMLIATAQTTIQLEQGSDAANVFAVMLGLLIPTRVALPLIVLVGLAELVFLWVNEQVLDSANPEWSYLLAMAYLVALGSSASLARLAVLRAAKRALAAQERAHQQNLQALSTQAVTETLNTAERKMHETVLNSLTAIGTGLIPIDQRVRERAREAADVLTQLAHGSSFLVPQTGGGLRSIVQQEVSRAQADGISVQWDPADFTDDAVPERVAAAFHLAIAEAFRNVLMHARTDHVQVRAPLARGSKAIGVEIIDDGVGIDPAAPRGFGLRESVFGSLAVIGGKASVQPNPSHSGTIVRLEWEPLDRYADLPFPQILQAFVTPILAIIWVFTLLRIIVGWQVSALTMITFVAFALYTALVLFIILRARRGGVTGGIALLISFVAPMVYVLQQLPAETSGNPVEWSSEAVVSLFLVIIAVGPWWTFIPVAGMWLLMQGNVVTEILAPGFIILVAALIFSVSWRRSAAKYVVAMQQEGDERASALAMSESAARIQRRYEFLRSGQARLLLGNIAEGGVDPASPAVREACLREEQLLRCLMRLDPERSPIDVFACDVARASYAHRIPLSLDFTPPDINVDCDELEAVRSEVFELFREATADSHARMSVRQEDEQWIVRFLMSGVPASVTMKWQWTHIMELPGSERTWLLEWRMPSETGNH